MNKKFLFIILSIIFILSAPSIFAETVNTYQQTIADISAGTAEEYYNRGNAYQNQGNFQQAIVDYNKAIEINPDIAGFYSNRGNAFQTLGYLHQAIADYDKAIELNPNDNATYYHRGLAYYGIEQYGKSLADYTNAISKNPDEEAYKDFIKYTPLKKASDTRNVRNKILQLFAEQLNLDKKMARPAPDAAPVTASVVEPVVDPVAEYTVSSGIVAAVAPPFAASAFTVVEPVVDPVAERTVSSGVVAAVAAPIAASAVTEEDWAQVNGKENYTKSIPDEDVRNLILKWAASWESGNMKTYRSCYASNFQSQGMNLNEWISYKTNVRQKSRNINISIDDLHISAQGNIATAVFIQFYSSSILQNKSKKTLKLRKINDEWKIYKEII